MRTVIKALLAATALLPAGAYAQNASWQGRAERGEAHADRPERPDRAAPDRASPNRSVPDRDTADRAGRPNRPDRADWQRIYSGGRAEAPVPPQPGGADARRGFQDGRADRDRPGVARDAARSPNYGGRPDDRSRRIEDRRFDNGAAAVERYRDQRRDTVRGRQGWNANRGEVRYYGSGYDNRSRGWNRDWRRDDRYDWNRYRSVNRGAYRLPRYYAPSGWSYGYRRFSIGATLSSFLWDQDYWIDDPYAYRLPDAYGPYRWVRYYDDALLIDLRSGQVVDSVYGIFY